MLDGLSGAASDVIGRVTPASLYAHVDQTLGGWEQRPIYKANVQSFINLREVKPKVPEEVLRRLPKYFPTPAYEFKLDPSYEPDRGEEAERLKNTPVDDDHVRVYRELQLCNRHGLVVPTKHDHMWHSAVFTGGCRLTARTIVGSRKRRGCKLNGEESICLAQEHRILRLTPKSRDAYEKMGSASCANGGNAKAAPQRLAQRWRSGMGRKYHLLQKIEQFAEYSNATTKFTECKSVASQAQR